VKTKNLLWLFGFVFLILAGCEKMATEPDIVNDRVIIPGDPKIFSFLVTPTRGVAPLEIQFSAEADSSSSYTWDLGTHDTSIGALA